MEAAWALVPVAAAALVLAGALLLPAVRLGRPTHPDGPARRVSVVVPCRGHHQGFEDNVRAILRQDQGAYEVVFVLDEAGDPAHASLRSLRGEPGLAPWRVVLSDPKAVGEDWPHGKVIALLTGARAADPRSEVLVFADGDIRPAPGWLRSLTEPLEDPRVGGVTGYRWTHAATRATPWTALRDAWNSGVLDAMASPRHRFLWGGSMAVRRRDFEQPETEAAWRTHFAEDIGLTRALQRRGLRIAFAPGALVATAEDATAEEARAWVVRQTALTLAAMPSAHRAAVARHGLAAGLPLVGLAVALAAPTLALVAVPLLAPAVGLVMREALLRRAAARLLPSVRARPRRERALQALLAPAVPWLALWAMRRAARLGVIEWRGRRYRLATLEP